MVTGLVLFDILSAPNPGIEHFERNISQTLSLSGRVSYHSHYPSIQEDVWKCKSDVLPSRVVAATSMHLISQRRFIGSDAAFSCLVFRKLKAHAKT